MDKKEYEKLLDNAYAELPQVLYKKSRFEIPEVTGKLIKSRTVISNFRDIAKHFSRDTDHFTRFMLRELGVRGEIDNHGELVVHSRFQPAFLNKAVDKYFRTYVQCPHCNGPDTLLELDNTQLKCKACGHQEKVARL